MLQAVHVCRSSLQETRGSIKENYDFFCSLFSGLVSLKIKKSSSCPLTFFVPLWLMQFRVQEPHTAEACVLCGGRWWITGRPVLLRSHCVQ